MLKKYVITGGPSTGKTTVLKELEKEFKVFHEAAREILSLNEFSEKIQHEIVKKQLEHLREAEELDEIVFFDRCVVDSLAYYQYHGFEIPLDVLEESRKENTDYDLVFFLDFVPYVNDEIRKEDEKEAKKAHNLIYNSYKKLGYKIIRVPLMSVQERVNFIKSKIKEVV